MRIIDVHTHVWTDRLAAAAVSAVGAQGHIGAHYDGTVAGLIEAMDRAGIDASIILPVATKQSQVRTINDWAAGLVGHERLIPLGAMHPDCPDPAKEIARMRKQGLTGFKMHPEYQQFEPHEPRMERIYEAAIRNDMTVYFHSGGDVAFTSVRGTPRAFAEVLEVWPELNVVLAHLGGFRQWQAVPGRLAGSSAWFDTAYTLGHLADEAFVELVRALGTDRVMFGSDGPWTDAKTEIAHLRSLPFKPAELTAILGGNAERFLAHG
ncbi:MAG TPA: amidohydrolase family protein [Coriobacteriia bacterium]